MNDFDNIALYWDEEGQIYVDEDGFKVKPIELVEYMPIWAMNVARIIRLRGGHYWNYTHNGYFVEVYFPDHEGEYTPF